MNTSTNYLEQYDAAPDADKFPMVRRWIDTEPLPFFKELRAKRPILVTPTCTLVTRFDDVREILKMYKVFTVKPYVPKMANYLMMHDDDALHTREKSLMQFMLKPGERIRRFYINVNHLWGKTRKIIKGNTERIFA